MTPSSSFPDRVSDIGDEFFDLVREAELADRDVSMTADTLRLISDRLGLSATWLSTYLDVSLRTLRRWEAGERPIPDGAAEDLRDLCTLTRTYIRDLATELTRMRTERVLHVPAGTELVAKEGKGLTMPTKWWHTVAAYLVLEVEGLNVIFDEAEEDA